MKERLLTSRHLLARGGEGIFRMLERRHRQCPVADAGSDNIAKQGRLAGSGRSVYRDDTFITAKLRSGKVDRGLLQHHQAMATRRGPPSAGYHGRCNGVFQSGFVAQEIDGFHWTLNAKVALQTSRK